MYEYRQIIVRLRQGDTIHGLVREGLASRKKARDIRRIALQQGWLELRNELPEDAILAQFFSHSRKSSTVSLVLPFQEQIKKWHQQNIQASTIHAALQRQHGFTGSYFSVYRFVRKLQTRLPDTTTILEFKPGEAAQVDFGSGPELIDPVTGEIIKTWFFVMVLAWSRHMYAEIVLHQDVETWLGCHRRAFEWFGGVPSKVIIDNPKCAITRACYHDPVVQRAYAEYAEGYGFLVSACPPRDPKKKGRCESGVKYVKKAFIPIRKFRDLTDSNQQLHSWAMETAGQRVHGTTHEKPLVLFEIERHLLKALPENPPECAIWLKVKLHGDCHVTVKKCRYSAPWKLAGQVLWARLTETTVRIYRDHEMVAIHPRKFKPGQRSTQDEHIPPNALAYAMRDSRWCMEQAEKTGPCCKQAIHQLLTDSVVDYLRAAQGILGFLKKYGDTRLEAACRRALSFQSVHYRTIKTILENGQEFAPLPEAGAPDPLAQPYLGQGRFSRNTSTLLQ